MKKIFVMSMAILFASFTSFSQKIEESDLPKQVLNTFKSRFVTVKDAKWEKEDTIYTAEFLMGETGTEVEISENGTWISTEWEIPVENTPQAIKDYIKTNFAGYNLVETAIEEIPVDGKVYAVEISKKKDCQKLYFSLKSEFSKAVKENCDMKKKCCKEKKCCKKKEE